MCVVFRPTTLRKNRSETKNEINQFLHFETTIFVGVLGVYFCWCFDLIVRVALTSDWGSA